MNEEAIQEENTVTMVELPVDVLNAVLQFLSQQPYVSVAELIEKVRETAKVNQ